MAETGTLYDAFIDELRGTRSSPTLAEGGINQDAADATAEKEEAVGAGASRKRSSTAREWAA